MPEPWNTALAVIASLGGGGFLVLALSSWLGKVWAERILSKEKSKLEMLINEHQVKFSRLHQEQAEAIKTLYSKLLEIRNICGRIVIWAEHEDMGIKDAREKLDEELHKHSTSDDFRKFYKENEIFFPESISSLLEEIWSSDSGIWVNAILKAKAEDPEEVMKTLKELEKKIDTAMEKLKKEFRKLLGVEE